MGLVEKSKGKGEGRKIHRLDPLQALHGIMQAVALDHPLGTHADVLVEQPLNLPGAPMSASSAFRTALISSACFCLTPQLTGQAASKANPTSQKEVRMTSLAKGSFDVTVKPLAEGAQSEAWAPGRMSLEKQFKGDLEATSKGEMLTAMTETQGSAGYTAIEKISGRLHGRNGTFLLQHFAVMSHGVPGEWIVMVVPDSGTGGLKGLTGKMTITITGKQHAYALEYSLPDAP